MSILAKSATIIFLDSDAVSVVHLDHSTDRNSSLQVKRCDRFDLIDHISGCSLLTAKVSFSFNFLLCKLKMPFLQFQEIEGSALKNGTEWSHFQFTLRKIDRASNLKLKITKYMELEVLADVNLG
jgi:hypothetical protein